MHAASLRSSKRRLTTLRYQVATVPYLSSCRHDRANLPMSIRPIVLRRSCFRRIPATVRPRTIIRRAGEPVDQLNLIEADCGGRRTETCAQDDIERSIALLSVLPQLPCDSVRACRLESLRGGSPNMVAAHGIVASLTPQCQASSFVLTPSCSRT